MDDGPRHPGLVSGSSFRKPRFLIKSGWRENYIYRQQYSATYWLVMKDCVAHPVSRTGVGNGNSLLSAYNEYNRCLRL